MLLWISRAIICISLIIPALGMGGGIIIEPGSSFSLGDGTVDLGCSDLSIGGQLDIDSGTIKNISNFTINTGNVNAGSGTMQLSGDWSNSGTFTAGTSLLAISDGCGKTISAINDGNDFYAFSATSSNGKILQIEAGSTQVFTHSLALAGRVDKRLIIRSSNPGVYAFFTLQPNAVQNIFAVDVKDNNAQGGQLLAPELAAVLASIDAGNNDSWFLNVNEAISDPLAVPTLSRWALLVMIVTLISTAFNQRRLYIN